MWDLLTKYSTIHVWEGESSFVAIGVPMPEVPSPSVYPPKDWYLYNEHQEVLLPYLAGKALEFHPIGKTLDDIKPIVLLSKEAIGPRFDAVKMRVDDVVDVSTST